MIRVGTIRYALSTVLCIGVFSLIGIAWQVPSITDNVYSTTQAERAGRSTKPSASHVTVMHCKEPASALR